MDVGDWLRSLGLGGYEATFRESEIEADVFTKYPRAQNCCPTKSCFALRTRGPVRARGSRSCL
jgi:SAM domain (Sterile alpha motif)